MIRLHREPVDAALTDIDTALAAIEAELETLRVKARRLESSWDGEARAAFARAMRDCDAILVDLNRVASALTRVGHSSVTRIDEFDQRRVSAWSL